MTNTYKILVTGGSGFIGINTMDYLIQKGISCINVDFEPPKKMSHQEFWYNIDIRNFKELEDVIRKFQPTHILHLAATLGMDHKSLDTLDTNIQGVENLVQIVEKLKYIKRTVFTSSLLVCKNGYVPQSETDYCPPNLYGESKMIGEKIVRTTKSYCNWVIVRPTSIWGPWFDYSYKAFYKTIDKNRYVHIGRDEFQKPASYVGNTVHMLIKILLSEDSQVDKETYYLADYPWYSTKEWANSIQEVLQTKPIKTAPLWLLRSIAIFGDILKTILGLDPPLTSFRLKNMLTGGDYPTGNTEELCGKLPFSLNQGVQKTAQWMYENNLLNHNPTEK